jgi:putative transposase
LLLRAPEGGAVKVAQRFSAGSGCIFSTKDRKKTISADLQPRLWEYLGGIADRNKMKALAIGGVEDHVHLLLSLPADLSLSKSMQFLKGGSSKWIHEMFPDRRAFAWQEGYAAFSVSNSQRNTVEEYVLHQAEHHRKRSFEEEFVAFLKKNGIAYGAMFIFG